MSTLLLVSMLHVVAICLLIGASRANRLQLVALKQRTDAHEERLAAIEPAQLAELDHAITARLVALDTADADDGLRRLVALSEARASALAPRRGRRRLFRHRIVWGPDPNTAKEQKK